jgi:hypothetical protein
LLKRDSLFVIERLASLLDESRIEMLARQHGIRQRRDDGGVKKTLTAFVRRADEGTLSRLLVEASILPAVSRGNPSSVLKEAATTYKVDTEAIATKVKQEFAAKERARRRHNRVPRQQRKQPSKSFFEGRRSGRPSVLASKSGRENPCWFLPPPSSRHPAFARRRVAGVKFLLLHLPVLSRRKRIRVAPE